jgi:hypothetical protein
MLSVVYAESHIKAPYAECHYAECRGVIVDTKLRHLRYMQKMYVKATFMKQLKLGMLYFIKNVSFIYLNLFLSKYSMTFGRRTFVRQTFGQ